MASRYPDTLPTCGFNLLFSAKLTKVTTISLRIWNTPLTVLAPKITLRTTSAAVVEVSEEESRYPIIDTSPSCRVAARNLAIWRDQYAITWCKRTPFSMTQGEKIGGCLKQIDWIVRDGHHVAGVERGRLYPDERSAGTGYGFGEGVDEFEVGEAGGDMSVDWSGGGDLAGGGHDARWCSIVMRI